MTTIYLSSTYEDLKDYRSAVFEALRKAGYEVKAMEDYVATDRRPVDKCLADVAEAHIYVGLFAFRYGYVPPAEHGNPDGLSITELEFRHAEKLRKPCLAFVVSEDAPWPPKFIDGLKGERINRLREYLLTEKSASFFSSPHQMASLVQAAVTKYLSEKSKQETEAQRKADEESQRRFEEERNHAQQETEQRRVEAEAQHKVEEDRLREKERQLSENVKEKENHARQEAERRRLEAETAIIKAGGPEMLKQSSKLGYKPDDPMFRAPITPQQYFEMPGAVSVQAGQFAIHAEDDQYIVVLQGEIDRQFAALQWEPKSYISAELLDKEILFRQRRSYPFRAKAIDVSWAVFKISAGG